MSPARVAVARSPRLLGYAMPAEWEPHEATWLAWPYDPITFPDRVPEVEARYLEIISALLPGERVDLLVRDAATAASVRKRLEERGAEVERLRCHAVDYADVWVRDYGPLFVRERSTGGLAFTKWTFNAWGRKYEGHLKDDWVFHAMSKELRVHGFDVPHVLEGGSIDVNGRGTLLTTEQCLLNPNRNGKVDKREVESWLLENLGASHVIWLRRGIEGDDTDGHIDDLARFANPTTVLCAYGDDGSAANRAALEENYALLREATDQDGHRLKVVTLPMPGFVGDTEGRLPASYANFYIGNRVVLAPTFGQPQDAEALEVIRGQFPGRQTVAIPASDMVFGLGTLHCATLQQPVPGVEVPSKG